MTAYLFHPRAEAVIEEGEPREGYTNAEIRHGPPKENKTKWGIALRVR
jgi:hypothetical protein